MALIPFESPAARKARERAAEILALKQEREDTSAPGPVPFGGPVARPTTVPFGGSMQQDVARESQLAARQRFRMGEQRAAQPTPARPGPRTVPQRLGYWKPEDVNDEEWNTALRREFERRGLPANTGLPVGSPLTSINEALADTLYQRGDEEAIKAAQAQARAKLALPVEMAKGMTEGARATRLPGTDVYPFGGNKEMAERVAEQTQAQFFAPGQAEYESGPFKGLPTVGSVLQSIPFSAASGGIYMGPGLKGVELKAGELVRKAAPVVKQVGSRALDVAAHLAPASTPSERAAIRLPKGETLAAIRKLLREGNIEGFSADALRKYPQLFDEFPHYADDLTERLATEETPWVKAHLAGIQREAEVLREQELAQARRDALAAGQKPLAEAAPAAQPQVPQLGTAPSYLQEKPFASFLKEVGEMQRQKVHPNRIVERAIQAHEQKVLSWDEMGAIIEDATNQQFFSDLELREYIQQFTGRPDKLGFVRTPRTEGPFEESMQRILAREGAKPQAAAAGTLTRGVSRIDAGDTKLGSLVRLGEKGPTHQVVANDGKRVQLLDTQGRLQDVPVSTKVIPSEPAGVAKPLSVAPSPAQAPAPATRAATPPQPAAPSQAATGGGAKPPTGVGATPPGGGVPPPAGGAIPPANPINPRPRTLLDMNREAKGMRALTPEQRAAVMDVAQPITGDVIYQAKPFNEHAQNLLGPDTPFMRTLRRLPGVKQAFGAWNPAQMARENPTAMIGLRQAIFQEVEKSRARFSVLRWWNDADDAFDFKQTGTALGLKPSRGVWRAAKVKPAPGVVKGKMFGTINDLIEHPERYVLSNEQQRVLSLADSTLTQSVRDAQRAGVDVVELAEAYWPRSVIKGPKDVKGFGAAKRRISSSKGYTHQRAFSDIDDLVAAGYEVETDPRRVFASRLEAGIDTIAHQNSRKQIAALPGVEKPLERMAARYPATLKAAADARAARDAAKAVVVKAGAQATPADVVALRQAEADYITSMKDVFAKKIEAGTPGYYELRLPNGRIAPQELVGEIGKAIELPELSRTGSGAASVVREVSQLLRTTLTNVDLAAGFIQGQSLLYRNNVAWGKAQAHALISLVDDPTAYVAKNADMIDEGVRAGAIVPPTEFLFAKQGLASIPLRVPVVGQGLRSFNRAFEWFITVGQTELYKAARQGPMKNAGMEDLVSLGSAIRKQVGTESYAILGVRHNQQTVEALSLFAARFFRANVGILGQSFTAGPGGASARAAVGSLITGGAALTVGVSWAQNKKLPNMTDPYMPDWMQVKFGEAYYNFYGPFYGYFRTLARMSVSIEEGEPARAAKEAKRFLTSKESLPLRAIDIAGQLAYYGQANVYGTKIEKTPAGIAKGLLTEFVEPIALQETAPALLEGQYERALDVAGMQGRPENVGAETNRTFENTFPSLRKMDISLGYVSSTLDMVPGTKGGEVELTPQQRDKYQQMTAALVIDSLTKHPTPVVKAYLAMPDEKRKRLTPRAAEEVKEALQRQIDVAKDSARIQFRAWLTRQGVRPPAPKELVGAGAR